MALSSDSESECFFDAEDASPARITSEDAAEIRARLASSPTTMLEEAEKKLLEAKRIADERRRKEDEEIEKQLEELEKKKEEAKQKKIEKQQKLAAEKRATENEKRRKKLDDMRRMMSDNPSPETSSDRPPPKPPRLDTGQGEGETSTQVNNISETDPDQTCVMELVNDNNSNSVKIDNTTESQGQCEGHEVMVTNISPESSKDNTIRRNLNISLEENEHEKSLSNSKNFADLTNSESKVIENKLSESEPDLVQCVNPPRVADGPTGPVAPPRRKKKPNDRNSAEGVSLTSESEPSQPLATPTTTVFSLTKELEHSLDLHSATRGESVISTEVADAAAPEANTSEDHHGDQGEKDRSDEFQLVVRNLDTGEMMPVDVIEETLARQAQAKAKPGSLDGNLTLEAATNIHSPNSKSNSLPRPRSNSGRFLSDKEILEAITVLNLDTGEIIPLSVAEEKLPQCVNPMALHIMRRTKEYSSGSSLHRERQSDDDDDEDHGKLHAAAMKTGKEVKKKTIKIKKFLGKTVSKIKSKADEVLHDDSSSDEEVIDGKLAFYKIKASRNNKGPYDFFGIKPVQDLGTNNGAVWTMKFSHCGRLLATGGQDSVIRIWVLKDAYAYFDDMRQKYSESKVSPAPSQESLGSMSETHSETASLSDIGAVGGEEDEDRHAPFVRKPFCIYRGHTADVLDISWSKNYFVLSSSMDKTVRLWHVSRKECLCCFQHIDFVTAIAFHPRDDRYFLSGSLDGKLRLWNIPDKKVALWNEVRDGSTRLITAANFCQNGKFAVVGTYDGRCIFFITEQLKYFTQIHVRSTRGKNAKGRKISGIEPLPGEDKILVTSNDSRIRLYDLRDLSLTSKYKGCANNSSQIKSSFSSNGKYIICGSEDHFVYIWKTNHDNHKFTSARRDRNAYWEGIKAHTAVVTAAIFAPNPALIIKPKEGTTEQVDNERKRKNDKQEGPGEVLVSADFTGLVKVFVNKVKSKETVATSKHKH
ncbi:unnamed protein product [Owenia fusiformis]|uniref:Uncharacterized protein n=1 Tax=Owenia fusiformis TaxID=6347 RepID=A0A8J1V162_OWEFU|nr:unnamed protein product [Owenia fusiformis]